MGQIRLAQAYETVLAPHGLTAAQVLVTLEDSEDRRRYLNSRRTLGMLIDLGAVPIVNENDTVATDEIRYGDNDRLAAQVASMAGADVLVLLSDVDGLYTANPRLDPGARRLERVTAITPEIEAMAGGAGSALSRGGMKTKIIAARTAMRAGCAMAISEGAVHAADLGAWRRGPPAPGSRRDGDPHAARKRWISGMKPRGRVTVDAGAVAALGRGKSLLPAGVTAVEGGFLRGDPIEVLGPDGAVVGRALAGYDAYEARLIMGHRSDRIAGAPRPPGAGGAGAPGRPGALRGKAMDAAVDVKALMREMGEKARAAAAELAYAPSARKDAALRAAADAIWAERGALLAANAADMARRAGEGAFGRHARPAGADRGAGRGHGRGAAGDRRPARPGRRGDGGVGPALGAAHPPGADAARGGGGDLREPAERDRRRGRALPEGRERGDPARRVGEPPLGAGDPCRAGGGARGRQGCRRRRSSWCRRPTGRRWARC